MHLRNYIKLLFVLMLTVSVGLFMFSAYALLAGRVMEKEYISINKEYNQYQYTSFKSLQQLYFTTYELQNLGSKYRLSGVNGYWGPSCYLPEEGKNEEAIVQIKKYNQECSNKGVPQSEIRSEVEEVFKKWGAEKISMEMKIAKINSRIYADGSGKGKLDTAILDTFTKMAGIGTAISVLVLILIYRIPETPSERKEEHPKHK